MHTIRAITATASAASATMPCVLFSDAALTANKLGHLSAGLCGWRACAPASRLRGRQSLCAYTRHWVLADLFPKDHDKAGLVVFDVGLAGNRHDLDVHARGGFERDPLHRYVGIVGLSRFGLFNRVRRRERFAFGR